MEKELINLYSNEWYSKRFDLKTTVGRYLISTVDLGIPHFGGQYETMIFDDVKNEWKELYIERYETEKLAKEGHKEIVKLVKQGKLPYKF